MQFVLVYIQEAHPGSITSVPNEKGVKELQIIPQTATTPERMQNLWQFMALMKLTMPAVIDSDDNLAKRDFAGWPDRLYSIGLDGKIAFKSAPGPVGFKVPNLEASLHNNIK